MAFFHGKHKSNSDRTTSTGDGKLGVRSMEETSELDDESFQLDFVRTKGRIDESRLVELMHALQRLARLRILATTASVHARQKKREASIKRQKVWLSDGKFMEEIQRLTAQGKFEGSENLGRLALSCQLARDNLGPIEQESIETEQEWEGHAWSLHQAEEEFGFDFQFEFEVADSYPILPSDSSTSEYETSPIIGEYRLQNDDRNEIPARFPQAGCDSGSNSSTEQLSLTSKRESSRERESSILWGIGLAEQPHFPSGSLTPDSDSGFDDIDRKLPSTRLGVGGIRDAKLVSRLKSASNEFYPNLLVDFTSTRERINRWLENTILLSRLEATSILNILGQRLAVDNRGIPSNWAQLVVAYWECDEAAAPYIDPLVSRRVSSNFESLQVDNFDLPVPHGNANPANFITSHMKKESPNSDNTPTLIAQTGTTLDETRRSHHVGKDYQAIESSSRCSLATDRYYFSDSTMETSEHDNKQ